MSNSWDAKFGVLGLTNGQPVTPKKRIGAPMNGGTRAVTGGTPPPPVVGGVAGTRASQSYGSSPQTVPQMLKTPEGALTAVLYLESTDRLAVNAIDPKRSPLERNDALNALSREMSLICSTILNRVAYVEAQAKAKASANGLGVPGGGVLGVIGAKGQYEGFSRDASGNLILASKQVGRLQAALCAKEGSAKDIHLGLAGVTTRFMLTTGSPFLGTNVNNKQINGDVMAQRTLGAGGPGFTAISLREASAQPGATSAVQGSGNAFFVKQ